DLESLKSNTAARKLTYREQEKVCSYLIPYVNKYSFHETLNFLLLFLMGKAQDGESVDDGQSAQKDLDLLISQNSTKFLKHVAELNGFPPSTVTEGPTQYHYPEESEQSHVTAPGSFPFTHHSQPPRTENASDHPDRPRPRTPPISSPTHLPHHNCEAQLHPARHLFVLRQAEDLRKHCPMALTLGIKHYFRLEKCFIPDHVSQQQKRSRLYGLRGYRHTLKAELG
ncbi:hypothetical protein F5Y15DRAFT_426240, partial [Xylariaceae sp. FL0016]